MSSEDYAHPEPENKIYVRKLTRLDLLQIANTKTSGQKSNQKLMDAYRSEHSTIRTQIFWIECNRIHTFVMGHLVRHHVGSTPFVGSQRIDRGGSAESNRYTLTDMGLLINAQSLIDMMHTRLCNKASKETQDVARLIRDKMVKIDPELALHLVPSCVYRNGLCPEKTCGKLSKIMANHYWYKEMFPKQNRFSI